jgi:hypothetical protein
MDVFVARMRDGRGRRRDTPCVIWVAYDGFHVLRGRPGEDKRELLKRWRAAHGATPKVVTIKDECTALGGEGPRGRDCPVTDLSP